MYIELTTGNDSFRKQGSSQRRNVSVASWVRVDNSMGGRTIIPVFEAFRKKLKYFRETHLIQQIPATAHHGPGIAGSWYVNRHEFAPGTEILIEYRHRVSTPGSFEEAHEYFMLVADETAPLYQVNLDLPFHHLSAVPNVQFRGRFEIVKELKHLNPDGIPEWLGHFDIDDDDPDLLPYYLDPQQEDGEKFFSCMELESRSVAKTKVTTKIVGGKKRIKIRRRRAIRTR